MKIFIVGLGLIGGSMAKALCAHSQHQVFGYDHEARVNELAERDGIKILSPNAVLTKIDLTIIGVHPQNAAKVIEKIAARMSAGKIIIDLCGVKMAIVDPARRVCTRRKIIFIGGHPMAGKEVSGYKHATSELFHGASMLLCPPPNFSALAKMENFFYEIGFAKVIATSPEIHDRIIAFTSQLPHILSSAYIKSPTAPEQHGFSAGSFRDLSRVAAMNADLWSELFLANRKNLLFELDCFAATLADYRAALQKNDATALRVLLNSSNACKKKIIGKTTKKQGDD